MTDRTVTIDYVGIESLLDYRMMVYGEDFTLDMELNNTNHPDMYGADTSVDGPIEGYRPSPNGEGKAASLWTSKHGVTSTCPQRKCPSCTFLNGVGGSLFVMSFDAVSEMESSGHLHYNVGLTSDGQPRIYSNIHLATVMYPYAPGEARRTRADTSAMISRYTEGVFGNPPF
jgi:hypothetical protein